MTSYKILWLLALTISVFVGVVVGRSKAYVSLPRWIILLVSIIAALSFLIGQVYSGSDHRYRILSLVGICLICAGAAYTFATRRLRRSK